jgi:anti-sigma factor RsiW
MTCDRIAGLLSPYIDGEIAAGERSEVEAHLIRCASCSRQLASVRSLKHAIARLPGREEPPGAVRARIESLRFRNVRLRASTHRRLVVAAAAVVLLAGTIYAVRRQSAAARFGDELVSDYLHSLPEVRPPEVASNDPREIIRFFSGKTPFVPVVPAVPSARLTGGRLCTLVGRPVELLFYTHDESGHNFSLFVFDHAVPNTTGGNYRGYRICSRRFGRLTVLAIGNIPEPTLEQILRDAKL